VSPGPWLKGEIIFRDLENGQLLVHSDLVMVNVTSIAMVTGHPCRGQPNQSSAPI
jgi:hypothetical protein